MFCTKCGASCADTAKFCDKCGAPLGAIPAQGDSRQSQRQQRGVNQQAYVGTTAQLPHRQGGAQRHKQRANGCVGQAWDDIISSPVWVKKLLLLGLINFVPILNFFVYGYALRGAAEVACGRGKPLGEIMETGNFKLGFFWFVMGIIAGVVVGIAAYFVFLIAMSGVMALAILLGIVVLALDIVLNLIVQLSCVRIALTGRFGEGFNFKEIFEAFRRKPGTCLWCLFAPVLLAGAILLGFCLVIAVICLIAGIGISNVISAAGVGSMLSGSSVFQAAAGTLILTLVLQLISNYLGSVLAAFETVFMYRAFGHYINLYASEWGAWFASENSISTQQPASVVGGAAAVVGAPTPPSRYSSGTENRQSDATRLPVSAESISITKAPQNPAPSVADKAVTVGVPQNPAPSVAEETVAASADSQMQCSPYQGELSRESATEGVNNPAPAECEAALVETGAARPPEEATIVDVTRPPERPASAPTPQSQKVQADMFAEQDNDPAAGTVVDTQSHKTSTHAHAEEPDAANAIPQTSTSSATGKAVATNAASQAQCSPCQEDLSRESVTEEVDVTPVAVPNPFAIPQPVQTKPESTEAEPTAQATVEPTLVDNDTTEATLIDNGPFEATIIDDDPSEATVMDNDPFEATVIDGGEQEATIIDMAVPAGVPGKQPSCPMKSVRIEREAGGFFVPTRFPSTIGKGTAADFQIIGNDTISRLHVRIDRTATGYTIEDMGSMNKSYLNGVELVPNKPVALSNHDVLVLSDERFTVRLV